MRRPRARIVSEARRYAILPYTRAYAKEETGRVSALEKAAVSTKHHAAQQQNLAAMSKEQCEEAQASVVGARRGGSHGEQRFRSKAQASAYTATLATHMENEERAKQATAAA